MSSFIRMPNIYSEKKQKQDLNLWLLRRDLYSPPRPTSAIIYFSAIFKWPPVGSDEVALSNPELSTLSRWAKYTRTETQSTHPSTASLHFQLFLFASIFRGKNSSWSSFWSNVVVNVVNVVKVVVVAIVVNVGEFVKTRWQRLKPSFKILKKTN